MSEHSAWKICRRSEISDSEFVLSAVTLTLSSCSSLSACLNVGSSSGLGWGSVTRKQANIWIEKYKPENMVKHCINKCYKIHQNIIHS